MENLVILITGASGGIGAATALRMAEPSCKYKVSAIALHYNSGAARAQAVLDKIHAINTQIRVQIFQADLASSVSIERMHKEVVAAFGAISVLFANAGTTSGKSGLIDARLENVSIGDFEATWRVNTLAPYHLTQLVVPEMQKAGFGRVIYDSSVAALTGGVVGPHYASSKSALHGLLHSLAGRHAKEGITFNAVAPALIEDTQMLPTGGDELKARIPVGRLGKPEEVASVVQVMIENGYVSNKIWVIDGGMYPC